MQAIADIWRNARCSARDLVADRRALAATEFAVIVPLMLVMFFGTVNSRQRWRSTAKSH